MKETTDEYFPSRWLKAEDFEDDKEVSATISEIKEEKVGEDTKPVVYFTELEKGLVLNKTNSTKIAQGLGKRFSDWPGSTVVLVTANVMYKSELVPCIRVKKAVKAASSFHSKMEDLNRL